MRINTPSIVRTISQDIMYQYSNVKPPCYNQLCTVCSSMQSKKGSSVQSTPNAGINYVGDFILHLQMLLITATPSLIAVSIVTMRI